MYRFTTCGGERRRYPPSEVDFIAAYVVPEDVWYVIPLSEIRRNMAHVAPHKRGSRARFEKFREAWGLLRGEVPGYGIELQACADEQSSVGSRQSAAGRETAENAEEIHLPQINADGLGCYFLEQTLGSGQWAVGSKHAGH